MIEKTILPNGFTVLTDSMPSLESAAVGVWVNTGSRREMKAEHGISHLLEHMAFKGTTTRTARQIAEEIEDVGGSMNAYTGRDRTAYHMRVLKNDVPLAIDLLGDILRNSTFDDQELAREKTVIFQEMGEAEDTPDDILFDYMQELCYPMQSIGHSILGTKESVGAMDAPMIQAYMDRNYRPETMILCAAGGVNHKAVVEKAEKMFGDMTPYDNHRPAITSRWGGGTRFVHRDLEQLHVVMTMQGIPYRDPDYFTSGVFSSILGEGMSSRLFQEIREVRGLAYSIYSWNSSQEDTGTFGIYAGTSPEDGEELLKVMADEFLKATDDINEKEVTRAKTQIKAGLLMGLEKPMTRCEIAVGHTFSLGRVMSTDEIVQKIEAITVEDVRRFGKRLLVGVRPVLCTIGPCYGIEGYETFINNLKSAS